MCAYHTSVPATVPPVLPPLHIPSLIAGTHRPSFVDGQAARTVQMLLTTSDAFDPVVDTMTSV